MPTPRKTGRTGNRFQGISGGGGGILGSQRTAAAGRAKQAGSSIFRDHRPAGIDALAEAYRGGWPKQDGLVVFLIILGSSRWIRWA